MLDIVCHYEAECSNCGGVYKRGSVNMNNKLFCKELEKNGWIIGETLNDTFCSKKCKESNQAKGVVR